MSLRVLELFSGIGGMHYACDQVSRLLEVELNVVAAVDINTTANTVYRHNHNNKHMQKNILGLDKKLMSEIKPDIILMSPPCQPHTRQGNRLDTADSRSEPLVHLLSLLPDISSLRYLLLENVQGFECSNSRQLVVDTLNTAGFRCQEFLVSPVQVGVPNSRLRYYLLAKRKAENWCFPITDSLLENFSCVDKYVTLFGLSTDEVHHKTVGEYLDKNCDDKYLISDKSLEKRAQILDIVDSDSKKSCCFTKSYSQYLEGTGSVIRQCGDVGDVYSRAAELKNDPEQYVAVLRELKLRFFSPREVSRLLGFPAHLQFPDSVTDKQCYKVLGNSLNVTVVALLLYVLIKN